MMREDMAASKLDEAFLARFGVRTDLALEAHQVLVEREGLPEIPGVAVKNEEREHAKISRVSIESDLGVRMLGKAKGNYVTIEAPSLRQRDKHAQAAVAQILAQEMAGFLQRLNVADDELVLVVGLGNWNATPDNVGPRTVAKLLVTRHLHEYQVLPPDLLGSLRPVSALSPGVLGLTGVETAEIVRGVVERVQPRAVICVDALASRSVGRLCTTIQLADTGINPGSGVGNKRAGLNRDSLGVPVIACGVPTVIYALTMVNESVDRLLGQYTSDPDIPQPIQTRLDPKNIRWDNAPAAKAGPEPEWLHDPARRKSLLQEVLGEFMGTMVVTPKEIDVLIDDVTDVLARGLNQALHPQLPADQIDLLR